MFPRLLEDAGFYLRQEVTNIGAATGTATHAGAFHSLAHKLDHGELAAKDEVEHVALDTLKERVQDGVKWDATTPNLNTGEKQVLRQTLAYLRNVAPKLNPISVESRLNATDPETGFMISGQADAVVTDDVKLHDLKTGVVRRSNAAQYGTYSRLLRAHGHVCVGIVEDYVQRANIKKPQPAPEAIEYDLRRSEALSARILKQIRRDLDDFEATGNEDAFLTNPNSMLCSDTFCPAWGTPFCKDHKE